MEQNNILAEILPCFSSSFHFSQEKEHSLNSTEKKQIKVISREPEGHRKKMDTERQKTQMTQFQKF